jgi:hypothetical protein
MKVTSQMPSSTSAELLAGEHGRDVDLLAVHADAAAGGDEMLAVVQWVFELGQAGIGSG